MLHVPVPLAFAEYDRLVQSLAEANTQPSGYGGISIAGTSNQPFDWKPVCIAIGIARLWYVEQGGGIENKFGP